MCSLLTFWVPIFGMPFEARLIQRMVRGCLGRKKAREVNGERRLPCRFFGLGREPAGFRLVGPFSNILGPIFGKTNFKHLNNCHICKNYVLFWMFGCVDGCHFFDEDVVLKLFLNDGL